MNSRIADFWKEVIHFCNKNKNILFGRKHKVGTLVFIMKSYPTYPKILLV